MASGRKEGKGKGKEKEKETENFDTVVKPRLLISTEEMTNRKREPWMLHVDSSQISGKGRLGDATGRRLEEGREHSLR